MNYYRTEDVALAAGATLRQLQWWDEKNFIKPTRGRLLGGRGDARLYTLRTAVFCAITGELRGGDHLSLFEIRKAKRFMDENISEALLSSGKPVFLLTTGRFNSLAFSSEQAVAGALASKLRVRMIDVSSIARRIQGLNSYKKA